MELAVGFFIVAIVAAIVYSDASNLRKGGAELSPALWGCLTFLILIVALPIYVLLRFLSWKPQIEKKQERHAPSVAPAPSYVAEIQALDELRAKGILTMEEFEKKKREILSRGSLEA